MSEQRAPEAPVVGADAAGGILRGPDPSAQVQAHRAGVGFRSLVEREIARIYKIWSQTIAAPVVAAMLYLAVFGVSLGHSIGSINGVRYIAYILPGVVLMQVVTQSYANNSSSVYQGRADGYIEDILASPMHAWQIAIGVLAGGVARAVTVGCLILGIAATFTDVHVAHPVEAVALVASASVLWASVGVLAGVFAQSFDQHMLVNNLVITPLIWLGGVFYSVSSLPHGLELVTRIDPLFYQVNGLRHAFLGTSDSSFVWAMVSTVIFASLALAVEIRIFVTGYRLKE